MTRQQKEAIFQFMYQVFETTWPHWHEYPFDELRIIEENEGDESSEWDKYDFNIKSAYWAKRAMEEFQ